MNQNHSNLLNKLIPILWEPGHMGAFFGRFLFDDVLEKSSYNTDIKKNYNKLSQTEWRWHDITSEYFQYNLTDWKLKLHDSWELLKEHFPEGIELDAAICYIVTYMSYPYFSSTARLPDTRVIVQPYKKPYISSELIEIANRDFDFNSITFPYIKSHIQGNIKRINQFPWKKKIICRLPENKAWMGDIFLFYKHYWYYIINPNNSRIGFMEFNKYGILGTVENSTHFSNNYKRYNPIDEISDYIIIDIYDLIFNENFEQLKLVDQRYDLGISETQLQLIRDTRTELIEILNIFGLSHTSDIITTEDHSSKFLTKEVLDIYNAVKKIGP